MNQDLAAMREHLYHALSSCDAQDFVMQEILRRALAMVDDRDLECHLLAVR
jgi:hypothetical protein